jgi:hypothetical protein
MQTGARTRNVATIQEHIAANLPLLSVGLDDFGIKGATNQFHVIRPQHRF